MNLYIAQDYYGNIYIVDNRDALPPDVTDFSEVCLPNKPRFRENEDATMTVDIQDYSEIISLERGRR